MKLTKRKIKNVFSGRKGKRTCRTQPTDLRRCQKTHRALKGKVKPRETGGNDSGKYS
jgi:hypothetical protein